MKDAETQKEKLFAENLRVFFSAENASFKVATEKIKKEAKKDKDAEEDKEIFKNYQGEEESSEISAPEDWDKTDAREAIELGEIHALENIYQRIDGSEIADKQKAKDDARDLLQGTGIKNESLQEAEKLEADYETLVNKYFDDLSTFIENNTQENRDEPEEVVDLTGVPKELVNFCRELGFSDAAIKDYGETAKKQGVSEQRLKKVITWINQLTDNLKNTTRIEFNEGEIRELKVKLLGQMINGYNIDYATIRMSIDNQILIPRSKKTQEEIEKTIKNIENIQKELEGRQKILNLALSAIAENTRTNQTWGYDGEVMVGSAIERMRITQEEINFIKKKQDHFEERLDELTGQFYEINLTILKNTRPTQKKLDQYLINIARDVESLDNLPPQLKTECEQAIQRYLRSNQASEFDRAFLAGNYEESIRIAIRDLNKRPDRRENINLTPGNIHELYRRAEGYQNNLERDGAGAPRHNFTTESDAYRAIHDEGYIFAEINENQIILMKRNSDGSINYFLTERSRDPIMPRFNLFYGKKIPGSDGVVPAAEAERLDRTPQTSRENLNNAISRNPHFQKIREAGEEIRDKFVPMQQLLMAGVEGGRTEEFVGTLHGMARDIKNSDAIKTLRSDVSRARQELNELRKLRTGRGDDPFNKAINDLEHQLNSIVAVVDSDKINAFCDQVLSTTPSTIGAFLIEKAIVFVTAIVFAVAAVVVALNCWHPGGWAGAAALAAAAGAIGGIVGTEIGTVISNEVGQAVYGEGFQNRTLLGRVIMGEQIYNPETQRYEDVPMELLAKEYGKQFAINFVTTFALLGLGKIAGNFLSKMASAPGRAGALVSKLTDILPKMRTQAPNLATNPGVKGLLQKLGKEILEEGAEESAEMVAEKIHPALGFIAQVYNCLDGNNTANIFGGINVMSKSVEVTAEQEVTQTILFNESDKAKMAEVAKQQYEQAGYKVEVSPGGEIICRADITIKGKQYTSIVKLEPTTENLTAKKLFPEGNEFGITMSDSGVVLFDGTKKENLVKHLKNNGFVISEDPQTGEFEARKGNEVIRFKREENLSAQQDVEARLRTYLEERYEGTENGNEQINQYESAIQFISGAKVQAEIRKVLDQLSCPDGVKQGLRKIIEQRALEQHFNNPEQYVSHGFDHSLNVMEHITNMTEQNPAILRSMEKKYGISKAEGKAVLQLVAIFHDFGYPEVGARGKALHALTGAAIASSPEFTALLRQSIVTEGANVDLMLYDFKNSILFHSADKVEIQGNARVTFGYAEFIIDSENIVKIYTEFSREFPNQPVKITCTQEVAEEIKTKLNEMGISEETFIFEITERRGFIGRPVDLLANRDGMLGIEYREASLSNDPMLFMIRLTDNLDMTEERFSEVQRTESFKEIYRLFSPHLPSGRILLGLEKAKTVEEISDNTRSDLTGLGIDLNQDVELIRKAYKEKIIDEVMRSHPEEAARFGDRLRNIAMSANTESIRHFGGCEAVKKIDFIGDSLVITVDPVRYEELSHIEFNEEVTNPLTGERSIMALSVAEYQIFRAAQAYQSLVREDGSNGITIIVKDTNGRIITPYYH